MIKGFRRILLFLGVLLVLPVPAGAQDTTGRAERADSAAVAVVSPEEMADSLLTIARSYLGVPYRLGATGPKEFDCSSYVRKVYSGIGIDLPRYTAAQIAVGKEIAHIQDLQRGDLVFFGRKKGVRTIGHIGIVVDVDLEHSDFTFIHCGTSTGVAYARYSHPYFLMRYLTARRVLPDIEPLSR